jgi:hypothetical protein
MKQKDPGQPQGRGGLGNFSVHQVISPMAIVVLIIITSEPLAKVFLELIL